MLRVALRPGPYAGSYRHVVVITLDTVRADHIGCYGDSVAKTPNLDRLAAESVRFNHVVTAAPTTLASHASIFTGVYPHEHGTPRNGFVVAGRNQTMAERLAKEGFETAAFISSFPLDKRFGLSQGFDIYDQNLTEVSPDPRASHSERRADDTTSAVLAFLENGVPDRLFLWVHYFDAHAPYDPPPPYDTLFPRMDMPIAHTESACIAPAVARLQRRAIGREIGRGATVATGLTRDLIEEKIEQPNREDIGLDALYRGEIAFLDDYLGKLVSALRDTGVLDDAILIVTADHGETMWEHGDFWNHGLWVYDTTVHVPLLVRLPGGEHGGTVVDEVVSTVDIMPTLMDLLDLSPDEVDGRSLVGAWRIGSLEPRAVFSEATQPFAVERQSEAWFNDQKPRCIRSGPWKYIFAPYLDYEELFNIRNDPDERINLIDSPTSESAAVVAGLRDELDRWNAEADPSPTVQAGGSGNETVDRLKSLGYIGGAEPSDED